MSLRLSFPHRSSSVIAIALAAIFPASAAAATITDDFADGSRWVDAIPLIDPSLISRGGGSVTFSSGRMNYLCASTAESNAAYYLNGVSLRLDRDWAVQADLHIAALAMSTNGQFAWQEIILARIGDEFATHVGVGFERGFWGSPVRYAMEGEVRAGGVDRPDFLGAFAPITAPDIAVRLEYNATTHLLSVRLDRNASAGGYVWESIGSTDLVAPSTGLNLGPTDSLRVLLIGSSEFQPLNDGEVWFDNFALTYDETPVTVITQQPQAQAATAGGAVTLSVAAYISNGTTPTYQWRRNGVDIPGATSATLVLPSAQAFQAGNYTCVVTANGIATTSSAAALGVNAPPANNARLANLSTRALVQTGDNVLIPGFVIAGGASKRLLIRAVGPTLATDPFNVPGTLVDPRLVLKRRNSTTQQFEDVANNDNWGTNANFAELKQTAANLFAFAIPDASADAALLIDLQPGEYTIIADGVGGATGIAIAEVYDADIGSAGSRLINLSNRGFCGVGAQVMIPGLVVSSEGPKTLLVRVVGPTLGAAPFNVSGTMTDPKLAIFSGSTPILTNDNWGDGDAAGTTQVAQQVFAFSLLAGSKDAAFVVTLNPGSYTVVGSSADGVGTGVVLVEVYVAP